MKSKSTILTAMALLVSSLPLNANIEDEFDQSLLERCQDYSGRDRADLQVELEDLLLRKPDDECIPYIIALLGTPPVALAIIPNDVEGGDASPGAGDDAY